MITQHNEIAETFVDHYTKISRDLHMKSNQKIFNEEKTRQPTVQQTIYREITESNHKRTEKHSIRWRHHTCSNNKKATTRNIEVPTKPV